MTHKYISEINPGQFVDGVYVISQAVLRSTTKGDLYIAMFLSDKTGKLNGRMWQTTEEKFKTLPREGFVRLKAKSEVYQNNLQLTINEIEPYSGDDVRLDDYMPRTDKNVKQMFDELIACLEKIDDDGLRALVSEFLNDAELMKKFQRCPAATSVHHSYLGGLLEHTVNMLNAAVALFPLYPKIQKDLVLAGIFLHDMGKTQELSYEAVFSYTTTGQLIGHITKSCFMIKEKAEKALQKKEPLSDEVLDSLLHIVLAHHGQYDFGSPKIPATAEAFMVSYIDNMDAKINQVQNLIENDNTPEDWTQWQKTLETRVYKKRVISDNE